MLHYMKLLTLLLAVIMSNDLKFLTFSVLLSIFAVGFMTGQLYTEHQLTSRSYHRTDKAIEFVTTDICNRNTSTDKMTSKLCEVTIQSSYVKFLNTRF